MCSKAIDAHFVTGTDGAGWTADESLALRHFLAALETRPLFWSSKD